MLLPQLAVDRSQFNARGADTLVLWAELVARPEWREIITFLDLRVKEAAAEPDQQTVNSVLGQYPELGERLTVSEEKGREYLSHTAEPEAE